METTSKPTFSQFKTYCRRAEQSLNLLEGYSARYKTLNHPFAKDHDGEYLEVTVSTQLYRIRLNFTYSIAYRVPLFFFMVYDQDSQPLDSHQIYLTFLTKEEQLSPDNEQNGIFLVQQPITGEYFYTLHHCDMQMGMDRLMPFYFSLLGLHPPLILS